MVYRTDEERARTLSGRRVGRSGSARGVAAMIFDDEQVQLLPTSEAIHQACAAIRATWGPGEEQKRRRWSIAPLVEVVEAPVVGIEVE